MPPSSSQDQRDEWARQLKDYRRIMANAIAYPRYLRNLQLRAETPDGKHLSGCAFVTDRAFFVAAERLHHSIIDQIQDQKLAEDYDYYVGRSGKDDSKLLSLALNDADEMSDVAIALEIPDWDDLGWFCWWYVDNQETANR